MLVDLKTGRVVFKDGGDVVLKLKHLLFITIIQFSSTNQACDNMFPVRQQADSNCTLNICDWNCLVFDS